MGQVVIDIKNKTIIIITMNTQNQMNGNNMMDMIKTQLMSFTMMKSMNGNNDKSGQDNGMINMIYIYSYWNYRFYLQNNIAWCNDCI
jgi:hypothetical protein